MKKINSYEEYVQLMKSDVDEKIAIVVNKEIVDKICNENIHNNKNNIILEIEDMSKLNKEELEKYLSILEIDQVCIKYQPELPFSDDRFSIQEYKDIQKQMNNILENIDKNQSNIEKFMTIYQILGKSIEYDYTDYDFNLEPSNRSEAYSMVGRFTRG